MGRGSRQGIGAQRHHVHADVGELEAARLQCRHLLEGRVLSDHHGAERAAAIGETLSDLRLPNAEQRAHAAHQVVQVLDVFRPHDDVERRAILDQDAAAPIEQGAARRGDRHEATAVVLGQRLEVPTAHHLQVPEHARQQHHHHDQRVLEHGQPRLDEAEVLVDPHGRATRR
jgi:hypothetical protein